MYQAVAGNIFDRLVLAENADHFATDVMAYYRSAGTVQGLAGHLGPDAVLGGGLQAAPGPGPGPQQAAPPAGAAQPKPNGAPPARPSAKPQGAPGPGPDGPAVEERAGPVKFGLADPSGIVVLPVDNLRPGDRASADAIRGGIPIKVDGVLIGTALIPSGKFPWSAAEEEFVNRSRLALGLAAATGVAAAVVIGMLLARGISRPVRDLTEAAASVAKGETPMVPVKGSDEVADLARAFNHMSAELDHAQTARRQMTADIAHELRNPLTTISGYVQAIRDGELEPTSERLDAVYRQTVRLGRIIEDLRTLSLADVGSLSLALSSVEPLELLRSTVENYTVEADQKGVTVRCEARSELGAIEGDPGRLTQVLGNLVAN